MKLGSRFDARLLESQGIRLVEALGDGEWIVSSEMDVAAARRGVRLPAESKLNEELKAKSIPAWAQLTIRGEEGAELLVYFHKDVSADYAQAELDRIGARVMDRSDYFERITATVRKDDIEMLAGMDWVRSIEPNFPPVRLTSNAESAALLKVKDIQEQFAIDGSGAKVAVIDDPVATHPEFGSRLKQLQVGSGLTHGTHVAGTVAAAGSTDPRLKGMAPAAQLVSMPFSTITAGIAANLNAKQIERADVGQNSWTAVVSESLNNCTLFGAYTSFEREMDRIVYQEKHPIVFAAGNDRDQDACLISARAGFYSISPPVGAKNLISVGAIDRDLSLSVFSSFGPTKDGRVKAGGGALGVNVLSTSVRNWTTTLSGTSMAAPAISGTVALLADRFRSKNGKQAPPELLRGLLMNTATDLGNPGPDYSYGFGLPDAVKSVKAIDEDTWRTDSVGAGQTREIEFEVGGGQPSLRVMLAWSDPPAPAGRTRQLMNDLDLKLISPDGAAYNPFVLDAVRPEQDARTGENLVDTVEQIAVAQPAAGRWKVVVSAKDLAVGPQDFAVVWSTTENPAPPCSTTVYPTTVAVSEKTSNVNVQVARSSTCEPWSVSDLPEWVKASEPSSNKATSTVKLKVSANESGQLRKANLLVAGRSVSLRQNAPCVTAPITPGAAIVAALDANDCLEDGSTAPYYTKIYTFEADAGQRVTIQADSNSLDAFLILYGPGGIFIAADDDSGGGLNARIPASGTLVLPVKGTYRISMTTALPSQTGSFTLNLKLEAASGNTSALPKVINACPAEMLGELTAESSKEGRRGDLYNTDIYLFQGRVGQSVKLNLAEADFDGVLQLIAPSGASVAFDDDSEGKLPKIESVLLGTGIYRLEVSSYGPFATGRYKLQAAGCGEWNPR